MKEKVAEILGLPRDEQSKELKKLNSKQLTEFAMELVKVSDGKNLGVLKNFSFSKFPASSKVQNIMNLLKQFPEVQSDKLALDKEFSDPEDRLKAVEAELKSNKISSWRFHELLYVNTEERTFFAGSASSLAKLDDMKIAIGEKQFEHYMRMQMPLSEYSDKMVSIGDLYLKDWGDWDKKEKKSLTPQLRGALIWFIPKEDQPQKNTVNVGNVDTHQVSTHKTADESHVRIFKRMLDVSSDLDVEASFENSRSVKINKTGKLEKFVQEQNKALQTEVNASCELSDEDLYNKFVRYNDIEKFKAIEYKGLSESDKESFQPKIDGFRFKLEAAKRFMDDMVERHSSGNGSYNYSTNSKATCGLTMEQMVATAVWAGKDKEQHHDGIDEVTSFIGIVESLYDMRRGYDIDHGTDKPEEKVYPKLNNGDWDNNRCHGGSVNSLANGMAKIHKSYEVKLILRSDIERDIQNIYKEIVGKNIPLFKGQEETLRIWTATGKITGDVRQELQNIFDVSHKQEFEGTYKGYINDNAFYNIILQGLDNVPIPDDLRRGSKFEGMSAVELYDAIKNEKIPLLHYSKERGFESTLNYLSSLKGKDNLAKELVEKLKNDDPKEPSAQNVMSYLSRSQLPKELLEKKVYELRGSLIPLSAIAELNERELSHLFSIDESKFLEEAARMYLYGLVRLALKNFELTQEELKGSYGFDKKTVLHIVCRMGDAEIAKLLIEKGADVNAKDQDDKTPLHSASENGHLKVVDLLIKEGADVNVENKVLGETPLNFAVNKGHLDIAKLLIENKADVNVKNKIWGETPLCMALESRQLDVAKLLISNGASLSMREVINCLNPQLKPILKEAYINSWKTALSSMAYNVYEVFKGAAKIQSGDFEGIYEKLEEHQNKNTHAAKEIANHTGGQGKKER